VAEIDTAQREFIRYLAAMPEGVGKHAAFIYGVLREPLFDTAIIANVIGDQPLTERAMLHIAAHWNDPKEADRG